MRAVIMATGEWTNEAALADWYPVPLMHLLDRPFLQHLVEFFARQGVRRYDFILSHLPEKIEHHLEDGARWGSQFTYHLVRDPARPYWLLKTIDLTTANHERLLFGHADTLPPLALEEIHTQRPGVEPLLFTHGPDRAWTGWALLTREHLSTLASDADRTRITQHLRDLAMNEQHWYEVGKPLRMGDFGDILAAQNQVMNKEFPELLLGAREIEPRVWLSRNVVLHPTAQVIPPIYLGENCEIGAMVKLGPHAVVGNDCIVDRGCTVTNALILPGSYVGQELDLDEVIIDRNRLLKGGPDGTTVITDDFILGTLSDYAIGRTLAGFLSRVSACLLLLLFAPLFLITWIFRRLNTTPVIQMPAPPEEMGWRNIALYTFVPTETALGPIRPGLQRSWSDFVFRFLPGLLNVAKGELRLVGVPPRSRAEIEQLPPEWRSLYLRCKAGLVTEASIRYGPNPSEDEIYAAEAYYAAVVNGRYDFTLIVTYLIRTLLRLRSPQERLAEAKQMAWDDPETEPAEQSRASV